MSQESFVATLVKECPEVRPLVEDRIREWNGDIVLHVIVADVRLLALRMFDAHETEVVKGCLGVVATGLTHGDGNVRDAVVVSFVERTPWWDADMVPFIASWPEVLQAEAERRRPFTAGTSEAGKPIFVIDGSRFRDLKGFARELSPLLEADSWHENLDALSDCLRGGYGTPEGGFVLCWINSAQSRESLGYRATAEWFKSRMRRHIGVLEDVEQRLRDAELERGPTLFDILVEIFRSHGPGGIEATDGVVLELQ